MFNKYFFWGDKINLFKILLTFILIFFFAILYTIYDNKEFIYRDEKQEEFQKVENIFFERLFFSIITQSTIGYGAIVPNSNRARFTTGIQALSTIIIILM